MLNNEARHPRFSVTQPPIKDTGLRHFSSQRNRLIGIKGHSSLTRYSVISSDVGYWPIDNLMDSMMSVT